MSEKRFMEVVASSPKPGKEAEYNEWYDHHIKEMFEFKGMKKVRRCRCYHTLPPHGTYTDESNCPRYLTTYEFESKEALDAFWKDVVSKLVPDADKKEKEGDTLYDINWAAYYEDVIAMER